MIARTLCTDLGHIIDAKTWTTDMLENVSELAYLGDGVQSKRREHTANASRAVLDSIFHWFDEESSGGLDGPELRAAFRTMGLVMGHRDTRKLQTDHKGSVDRESFHELVRLALEGEFDDACMDHVL